MIFHETGFALPESGGVDLPYPVAIFGRHFAFRNIRHMFSSASYSP